MPFAIPQQTQQPQKPEQQPKDQGGWAASSPPSPQPRQQAGGGWEASRQQQYRQPDRAYGQQQRQQARVRPQPQYAPQPRQAMSGHYSNARNTIDQLNGGQQQPQQSWVRPTAPQGNTIMGEVRQQQQPIYQQQQWGMSPMLPPVSYGGYTPQPTPDFLGVAEDETDPYNRRSLMGRGRY